VELSEAISNLAENDIEGRMEAIAEAVSVFGI
jgi:hypothetical protein